MVVKFCFASGWSPRQGDCGMEHMSYPASYREDPEVAKFKPDRLGDLGSIRYKTYTSEHLRARIEAAKGLPDDTKDIWRNRIICILAPLEAVFCINFIPLDPHQPQTLQVMRMKEINESADSYPVYCFDCSPYKFILPQEYADQVFELAQWDFSQIDSATEPLFLAIQYLKNEKDLKGMALTLHGGQGMLKTYIWIKD